MTRHPKVVLAAGSAAVALLATAAVALTGAAAAFVAGAALPAWAGLAAAAVAAVLAGFARLGRLGRLGGSRERRRRRDGSGAGDDVAEVTIDLRSAVPCVSTNDPLTGLVDRAYFRVTLGQRVASARRHLQPLSLILFEVNGFDHAKPERRDQAMRLLGSVLRRTMRECDTACRYGETAVAVLLEDTPESGAATAAERVRKVLHANPTGRSLTLSAGIACYPSHALDAHDILRRSVEALSTARGSGRDRVEIADGD